MNYKLFLQENQLEDSPWAQQEYQAKFGGAENLGLGPQIELQERGVHGRLMSNPNEVLYSPEGQEGRNFLVATDRYHNEFPLSGALEEQIEEQEALEAFRNEEFLTHPLTGELPIANTEVPDYIYQNQVYSAPIDSGLLGSTSAVPIGPSGYSSIDAMAGTTLPYSGEGVSDALALETASSAAEAGAESAWGGPATFAGNMALSMIPTRDRQKVNTPLGDEGSMSGILKGGGKGALLGGTISGGNPYAIAGGAALGVLGGATGYFDSTSAPIINISRIKQRGGSMPQGLLGGGSMYG